VNSATCGATNITPAASRISRATRGGVRDTHCSGARQSDIRLGPATAHGVQPGRCLSAVRRAAVDLACASEISYNRNQAGQIMCWRHRRARGDLWTPGMRSTSCAGQA
jgi:hypothetical protein